jgi:ferredoxin-thioredoxin reductase catalytic subunit
MESFGEMSWRQIRDQHDREFVKKLRNRNYLARARVYGAPACPVCQQPMTRDADDAWSCPGHYKGGA